MYRLLALMCACAFIDAQNIYTVAGLPLTHRDSLDGKQALAAPLANSVYGLLIDKPTSRLLLHDSSLVMRLEPDGSLLTIAGLGRLGDGSNSDGTLASFLSIETLRGMAQDEAGALYISDAAAGRVYRIAPDGTVSTYAGGGTLAPGFSSDGGPATAARLSSPRGLVFDSKGNLDIAEVFCACIRQVSPAGIISTLYTLPSEQNGIQTVFLNIEGLTIDSSGNLYFTEWLGNTVVKVTPGGSATTIAGTGVAGFSGDGGPATSAQLNGPSGVTFDTAGNLYITDSMNHRVRKIATDGAISTIAGTGVCGFSGDGGPATAAQLCVPAETVFDSSGNLYISDYSNARVRKMTPDGNISTIAGSGQPDPAFSFPLSNGDGGPAIHASFNFIGGVVFDASGNLYVSDSGENRVRKIAPNSTISTFAGTGQQGYSGDGGPATQAILTRPGPLAVAPDGSVYFVTGDSRVRKVTPDGIIHLVAGTGTGSGANRAQGDGGPAVDATLNEPGGVAFDKLGNTYIADTTNSRIRKIDSNGIITTIAGPGQPGIDYYNAVALDPQGNIYIAWTHSAPPSVLGTVNRLNPDGSLTPVVGNGKPCSGGPFGTQVSFDGSPALQAQLCEVPSMTIDGSGVMYLAYGDQMLRVTTDGIIHVVAGNALATAIGDGGPAIQAGFSSYGPGTPAFDAVGDMYIPETGINRIREVTSTALTLQAQLAVNQIFSGSSPVSQTIGVTTNFAEPFPYQVKISTADGGHWLTANRATGLTGESVTVTAARIPAGMYHGTVSVILASPNGTAGTQQVDVPVTFDLTTLPVNP